MYYPERTASNPPGIVLSKSVWSHIFSSDSISRFETVVRAVTPGLLCSKQIFCDFSTVREAVAFSVSVMCIASKTAVYGIVATVEIETCYRIASTWLLATAVLATSFGGAFGFTS